MTIDYSTRSDIRAASLALRKKHNALDWGAKIDDLIKLEGLSQARYSPFSADRWSFASAINEAGKKVKALISLKEGLILVAADLHAAREAFAKGHELGHSTLEWHRDILYICDEMDLSPSARLQMEWEANAFSIEILLPEPLLQKVYTEYPTSMETVLLLRDWSGASIVSCAIAFASNHPRKCVVLVLNEKKRKDGVSYLAIKNKVVSPAAAKSALGPLEKEQTLPAEHVIYANSRGSGVTQCQIRMVNDPQAKSYKVSILNNQYDVIAMIHDD